MKTAAQHAAEKIDLISRHHKALLERDGQMIDAVVHGHAFMFLGRRVLMTFEDTGLPTHEDPEIRRVFGPRKEI